MIAVSIAFTGAILGIVIFSFRSSGVYADAMETARNNPDIQETLGTPIEPGWFISGNINVSGQSGSANFTVPLEGPRGKGRLSVVADKIAGTWEFDELVFQADGDTEPIDLLFPSGGESF